MRERGFSTIGGILLATLAGTLTALALMDWVVVDVKTPAPDAFHIKVPFPVAAARVATSFVPRDAFEEASLPPEVTAQKEAVISALRTLLDAPDTTFVKVDAKDAKVDISKKGDNLHIVVDADDAKVRCQVPLDGLLDGLEHWDWQRVDPAIAFRILGAADHGDLVRVEADDGTKVAITMW